MEFKGNIEIIIKDIQDIQKFVSNFKNNSDIPGIELDIVLSKLRNVYDVLLMQHEIPENVSEKNIMSSEIPNDSDSTESMIDLTETITPEKKILTPEKDVSAGRKITGNQPFIDKRIGEQTQKADVSAKHQSSPIKSITGSMGINDKFFFVRELFNTDSQLFRQTLEELDASTDFNSAYNILINKFDWDMESEPVQMLLNLIKRKFISPGNE